MNIEILTVGDNYMYLLTERGAAMVIDPANADVVLSALKKTHTTLAMILVTHDHGDHTAGCGTLERHTGCTVIGPGMKRRPLDDEVLRLANEDIRCLSTPGHTADDFCYYVPSRSAIFTGDTMFAAGCGRLFGGTAEQMWGSLKKLRDLPDDTLMYCGHEYTVDNLEFALNLEQHNPAIATRLENVRAATTAGNPSVPSTMADEKKTNPFLRADTDEMRNAVDMPGASPVDVFAELRRRKNRW